MKGRSKADARRLATAALSKTKRGKDSTMSSLISEAIQLELPLFAIAESLPLSSETTSADKSPICSLSIQTPKSSKTLAQDSIFKRKGLLALLDRLMRGDKLTLVVACRDRLARFGFELIQHLVEQNGGNMVVLDQTVYCPNSELTQDLLAILHVCRASTRARFANSCRMHGLRSYSKKIKEDPTIPKP